MSYFKKEKQRVSFPELEHEILKFWESEGIFEKSVKNREGREKFVFIEGPPTANGLPHPGHVLTRIVKDLVLRYKTMRGFYVRRKAGWDTHGLPVEIEVEKELGISRKKEIEEYGIENFNKRCKESVFRYEREWVNMTKRVGFWIDMDSPYITFDTKYIESVWWSLKEIWKKGLLYRGHKVVPFCPRCETALSSHEVAQGYKEVEDPSIYVKFRLKDWGNTFLLAWTTTPWTLLANVALAVHPSFTYVRVRERGKKEELILAEERLDVLEGEYEVIERFKGEDLEGKEYEPLFRYARIEGEAHKIVTADFVTLEEGTGIVHIAPAFGAEDYEVCKEKGLGFCQPVGSDGRFTEEVPPLRGIFVKDADDRIIKMLEEKGSLYKKETYLHTYPFCWRCSSPLIYYARKSWFIRMRSLREELLANNELVRWYPSHIKHGRFGDFLENVEDWALSRERFWGTPLNIWICEACRSEYCVGSIEELKEKAKNIEVLVKHGGEGEIDLHRPYVDEVVLRCDKCGGDMRRVPDVIDCWYDSGAAPFAQWHYPFERGEFENNFPASFITEAIDQTRGWFYSLLAVSTAVFNKTPYLSVLSLGHVTDEKGEKMSKSKGNVVDPNEILEKAGADSLRWYFFTYGPPWEDIRFDERVIMEKQKRFLSTLWNSYFFFVTYASIDNFVPKEKEIEVKRRSLLDRWIISRLNSLIKEVIGHLEGYEFHHASRKIEEFVVNDLSNWYIRMSRRRFWVAEKTFDKDCAYTTLYEVLTSLCLLLAPFVPFITEYIYQNIVKPFPFAEAESVHLCDYPRPDEALIDKELEAAMEDVRKIVETCRRIRSTERIKVRQPLKEVIVLCERSKSERIAEMVNIIKEEANVHDVRIEGKDKEEVTEEFIKTHLVEDLQKYRYEIMPNVGLAVLLNVHLDKNLLQEGLARDIVRRIQEMRKQLDLEYEAKIKVMYEGDEEVKEAFRNFMRYICEETLATEVKEGKGVEEGFYEKKWNIDGKEVYIAIKEV
ncbi:MAG: isoleucine--tRNA ligase [Candidatus Methanospirareceae archaeon]